MPVTLHFDNTMQFVTAHRIYALHQDVETVGDAVNVLVADPTRPLFDQTIVSKLKFVDWMTKQSISLSDSAVSHPHIQVQLVY